MRGADAVNDELEVGFDERFEHRWVWAERAGRVVMVLFVGAALFGLLGHGAYSHRTAQSLESGLAVDFEPVARSQSATQITFHLDNPTAAATLDLFIGANVVEPMGLKAIIPQPISTQVVPEGLVMRVAVPSGAHDAELRLVLEPNSLGDNTLEARLQDHAMLHWTQFVAP